MPLPSRSWSCRGSFLYRTDSNITITLSICSVSSSTSTCTYSTHGRQPNQTCMLCRHLSLSWHDYNSYIPLLSWHVRDAATPGVRSTFSYKSTKIQARFVLHSAPDHLARSPEDLPCVSDLVASLKAPHHS